jgi:hypothetical protein
LIELDDGRGRLLSVREAKLADVPVGAMATAKLSANQKHAGSIRIEGPSIAARIKAVDADKGTLVILIAPKARGDNPDEKVLSLAKNARVTIEGVESKLTDLKSGDDGPFAMVRLSLDQKTAQSIVVGAGRR